MDRNGSGKPAMIKGIVVAGATAAMCLGVALAGAGAA